MKRKKRLVLWFSVSTAAVIAVCVGNSFWHETHTRIPNSQNTSNLGEIGHSVIVFRDRNHRWPESLEELKLSPTLCQDARSGEPYLWVANDHLYANTADVGAVKEKRVVMMLPHTFRSKPWPFGRIETIVLLEDSSVTYLPPSAIRKGEPDRKSSITVKLVSTIGQEYVDEALGFNSVHDRSVNPGTEVIRWVVVGA